MATLNNDIEKYLRGELTPAEMHALEQQALRDPFLAEALEGAEQAGADNFSVDIALLQKSIKEKSKKRLPKTISLNGWGLYAGIAAGLTLLALSTYVIFISIDQQQRETISATEQVITPDVADDERKPVDSSLIAMNSPQAEQQPKEEAQKQKAPQKPAQRLELKSAPAEGTRINPVATGTNESGSGSLGEQQRSSGPIAAIEESELGDAVTQANQVVALDESADDISKAESKKESRQRVASAPSGMVDLSSSLGDNLVKGKVVADDGSPLPGVNVVLKGTTRGTVTDHNGYFQINVPPDDPALEVSFIGYSAQEVVVRHSEEITINMQPDVSALSEVVVTGYSASSSAGTEEFDLAQPSGGRNAFNEYLEKQLKYPKEALANNVEGKVTVQFVVEPNGQLSDFKVIKGIGFGCEEELLRLIRQGPAWIPSKKNNQAVPEKIKVRLKFELPKK
jgi:TonB family protein